MWENVLAVVLAIGIGCFLLAWFATIPGDRHDPRAEARREIEQRRKLKAFGARMERLGRMLQEEPQHATQEMAELNLLFPSMVIAQEGLYGNLEDRGH